MIAEQPIKGDTRNRLIECAMRIFGERGYEGTATRDLAREAGVALSAIGYHFGGKPELYKAAAERAAEIMAKPLDRILIDTMASLAAAPTPAEALDALHGLMTGVVQSMLSTGCEIEAASQFAVREMMLSGPTQEIIYARVIAPSVKASSELLAIAQGRPAGDPALLPQATALFGPVSLFRILHNHSLASMSADDSAKLHNELVQINHKIINALASPSGSPSFLTDTISSSIRSIDRSNTL